MNADAGSTLFNLISRTATPVVMIAACATLILGVNAKLSDVATRLRAAAAEFRQNPDTEARRRQLYTQIGIFRRRFYLAWLSLCALYLAVICFMVTALLILLTQRHLVSADRPTLILFSLGTVLMLLSIVLEFGEIALSTRSLNVEISDILPPAPKSQRQNIRQN